jgi:group I intron endonuclease
MPFKIKIAGIYKIQRIGSPDCYIGQTLNTYRRWAVHRHNLKANRHHSRYLQNAFNKYGESSFSFEVIEIFEMPVDIVALTAAEQRWIDDLRPTYNMIPLARSRSGISPSPEARLKMSAAKKGKSLTIEHRQKMSAAHKARCELRRMLGLPHLGGRTGPLSEETKQKISEAQKGRPRPKASDETRAKMSASRMGKPGTMKGKTHSTETRQKMSQSRRRFLEQQSWSQL